MDPDAPVSAQERREAAWVERVRAGDERAFGEMFDAYYARLCAFAAGLLGSMDDAREVVLAVFVRVWERRAGWAVRRTVRAYLYGATRNRALNYAESRRRRLAHERTMPDDTRPTAQADRTPEDDLAHAELADAVWAAVDALPERRRQAFVLHRQHGLTYAEIAEAMGVTPKTVENQIGRALEALRAALPPELLAGT